MSRAVLREIINNSSEETEFVVIDNGSKVPFVFDDPRVKIVRNDKSNGVYPTFAQGFRETKGDVVAFFHSDLVVWEKGWDQRVVASFLVNPKLGMVGFIGSNEIDSSGGRGLGTTSSFMGRSLSSDEPLDDEGSTWTGSAAHHHGKTDVGMTRAAVVDGCAMIIKRDAWNDIGVKEGFPPHHFYDRLISTQLLEKNWQIGVLGIEIDHFSGQTVNTQKEYQQMAWEWLWRNGHLEDKTVDGLTYLPFDTAHNYDEDIYRLAEKMWMDEYRPKGFIPYKAN